MFKGNCQILLVMFCAITYSTVSHGESCGKTVSLDNEQVRSLMETIKATKADVLDQVFAIETLMCAQRAAVRDHAARTALKSSNESLRAKALMEILFNRQTIILKYLAQEGLSNDVYEWIKANPSESFEFMFYDKNSSCISLYVQKCNPEWVVDISGLVVDIKHRQKGKGQFRLGTDSKLVGTFYPKKLGKEVPAVIDLF